MENLAPIRMTPYTIVLTAHESMVLFLKIQMINFIHAYKVMNQMQYLKL